MKTASLLLGLLLLAPTLSGCLAGDNPLQNREVNESSGCSSVGENGTVRPGEPLSVQVEAGGAPAQGEVRVDNEASVGTVDLVLEHEGGEIWSRQLTGVEQNTHSPQFDDLDAGVYTLTASTEGGVADLRLELEITWGGGTCE